MRVAFYAPMKPPDDPVPSGDRTMARAFMAALSRSGHEVTLASRFRSHIKVPDVGRRANLATEADHEAQTVSEAWTEGGPPDLWFTYHNYHKAPDLLGPRVSRQFALPYVLAEASHARKRADSWANWFEAAEAASRAADLHLCLTRRDREGIEPLLGPGAEIVDLPPFLDFDGFPQPAKASHATPTRLVTVAMMRPGDKLASYRFLAEALETISGRDWRLDIVGDGVARCEVQAAFAGLPDGKIAWRGEFGSTDVQHCLSEAHVFVWPGFGEAFGLCYLEAQAMGLPVVALDVAGVSSVVEHGRTGLLVHEETPEAFGAAIAGLMIDRDRRERLGRQAAVFARRERSLTAAAAVIDGALQKALTRASARHGG